MARWNLSLGIWERNELLQDEVISLKNVERFVKDNRGAAVKAKAFKPDELMIPLSMFLELAGPKLTQENEGQVTGNRSGARSQLSPE